MRSIIALLLLGTLSCSTDSPASTPPAEASLPAAAESGSEEAQIEKLTLSDEEWKLRLAPASYRILREAATERAYTGSLWEEHRAGLYTCAGCDLPLFSSETKFDSGTGWPSYWQPVEPKHVTEHEDRGFFTVRTEVRCARCSGHLGHVFDDGPLPTGLRYCLNSAALSFDPGKAPDAAPLD